MVLSYVRTILSSVRIILSSVRTILPRYRMVLSSVRIVLRRYEMILPCGGAGGLADPGETICELFSPLILPSWKKGNGNTGIFWGPDQPPVSSTQNLSPEGQAQRSEPRLPGGVGGAGSIPAPTRLGAGFRVVVRGDRSSFVGVREPFGINLLPVDKLPSDMRDLRTIPNHRGEQQEYRDDTDPKRFWSEHRNQKRNEAEEKYEVD